MSFNRTVYFDMVRESLFSGQMVQRQVDGQNAILDVWEWIPSKFPDIALDFRWLSYMLATAYHETAQEMWPIEEYGKGKGQPYGEPNENGDVFYGRGLVQLTWEWNYSRATDELDLHDDDNLWLHPDRALDPVIASKVMFKGMYEGWFRSDDEGPHDLPRYFGPDVDDPFGARDIINGDENVIPSWSNGMSIGKLIEGYHDRFLDAIEASWSDAVG